MSGLLRPRQPRLRRAGARGPDRRPGHGYGPAVRPLAGLAACGPAGRGRAQLCCAGGACALPRAWGPKPRSFPCRCFPAGETCRRARRFSRSFPQGRAGFSTFSTEFFTSENRRSPADFWICVENCQKQPENFPHFPQSFPHPPRGKARAAAHPEKEKAAGVVKKCPWACYLPAVYAKITARSIPAGWRGCRAAAVPYIERTEKRRS